MLCIRVCVLLYVCSAVYETRTYGAMRGAGGNSPHLLYLNKKAVKTLVVSKLNRKFAAKTIIMKSYGRKIIDYIFKRWAERPAI